MAYIVLVHSNGDALSDGFDENEDLSSNRKNRSKSMILPRTPGMPVGVAHTGETSSNRSACVMTSCQDSTSCIIVT